MQSALARFIVLSDDLIHELEQAIASANPAYYGNAEIALSNVRRWHDLAIAGTLVDTYGHSGFGISKSDLMFGPAENSMYQLENIFVKEILPGRRIEA